MNKEEKEAIDDLKLAIEQDKEELPYSKESLKNKQAILNYISKLQKENEKLKEELFVERKTNISKYTIRNIIKNKLKEIESDADFETIEVLNELLNKIRLKNVYSFGKKMYIKEVV